MFSTLGSRLGAGIGIWTAAHYVFCALFIAGYLGLFASVLNVLFGLEMGSSVAWSVVTWTMAVGIFLWELLYRPATATMAGIGSLSIIAWFVWIGGNVLVYVAF